MTDLELVIYYLRTSPSKRIRGLSPANKEALARWYLEKNQCPLQVTLASIKGESYVFKKAIEELALFKE